MRGLRLMLSVVVGVVLAGCPGRLENPDCFPPPDTPTCRIPNFNVEAYLEESCGSSSCHSSTPSTDRNNNIDLVSPDVFDRLSMQHASWEPCSDLFIIDASRWQESFLIQKLRGTQDPACGSSMPDFGQSIIPQPELDCIGRWVVLGGHLDLDQSTGCYEPPPSMDGGTD